MSALEVPAQHRRATDTFGQLVERIGDGQWCEPTPCAAWNVRQLVNHVVFEHRWAVPLFAGQTVADVGDAFDGDLLGADPVAAWHESSGAAVAAVGPRTRCPAPCTCPSVT